MTDQIEIRCLYEFHSEPCIWRTCISWHHGVLLSPGIFSDRSPKLSLTCYRSTIFTPSDCPFFSRRLTHFFRSSSTSPNAGRTAIPGVRLKCNFPAREGVIVSASAKLPASNCTAGTKYSKLLHDPFSCSGAARSKLELSYRLERTLKGLNISSCHPASDSPYLVANKNILQNLRDKHRPSLLVTSPSCCISNSLGLEAHCSRGLFLEKMFHGSRRP